MIDWTAFFGSQPGYERVQVGGVDAARIAIHEAIYLAQCATHPTNNHVYIETADGDVLNFPNPVPSTLVRDVILDFYLDQDYGLDYQLNPLLSPSVNRYREEFPSFFEGEEKYLTTTRPGDGNGNLDPLDRIALTGLSFEEEVGEPITTALVSMYLRQQGYIVDPFNESLATPNNGHPDLFAVKLPELQHKLTDTGLVQGGFYLNELELPGFSTPETQLPDEEEVSVLEIESVRKGSFYDAKDETDDYLAGGWFDTGYGVRGFAGERVESWRDRLEVGFITFDASGEFDLVESPSHFGKSRKTAEVKERVQTIVKLALLKNLSLDATLDFLGVSSFHDTVPATRDTDLDAIISRLSDGGVLDATRES